MDSSTPVVPSESNDPQFLDLLANLNRIGAAINRIGAGEGADAATALQLIVESAIQVIPESSAFLYTYDPASGRFDPDSRVAAGLRVAEASPGGPRPEGLGMRAIRQRRRVFSYEEPGLEIHPMLALVEAGAVACYPLVVADQPLGALYVYLYEERPFTLLEQLMLENLVNQAAIGLYQIRRLTAVQRDLARKEEELRQLRRAGLLISSRLQLKETLEAILQMALEVTGARYGIFRLLDAEGRHLVTRAIAGEQLDRPLVEELPLEEKSVMGWVALHRRPVVVRDLREPPWDRIYYPLDAGLEMRAELAVPLVGASGRLEGVLNLESPVVGSFNEDDRRLLQALAAQAVIAIQEVRLLDALQEAAQWVVNEPQQQALSRLAALSCALLNASSSQVWSFHGSELQLETTSGDPPAWPHLSPADNLEQHAILSRQTLVVDSPSRSQRAWVVPLLGSGDSGPLGALTIYGPAAESGQSDWDHKVLACLANYAVLALQNQAHQEALRTAQEQRAVAETFAAVGDIAANLLHQLNNKVGTIPVRVQGIQDKCAALIAADHYLASNISEIECSATEAMETVRENLAQLRPIHLAEVSVPDCIREALADAHLPETVRVETRGLESLPHILAGQRSLAWVFANLVQNASEAMNGRGQITFSGSPQGDWVELAVVDDGPGIPPAMHERIFDWEYSGRRAQRSSKLGFGLWWVKTVMARLGGSVAVESNGRKGTTFRLKLPIARSRGMNNE